MSSSWPLSSTSNTMFSSSITLSAASSRSAAFTSSYSPNPVTESSSTSSQPPPSPISHLTAPSPSGPNGPSPSQFQDTWTTMMNRTKNSAAPDVLPRARDEKERHLQTAQQCDRADTADFTHPLLPLTAGYRHLQHRRRPRRHLQPNIRPFPPACRLQVLQRRY
ncbi:hypothetical protein BJ912DRAFT_995523 [Pholiota molesta]|nr:hypothetical protein BJ912DRAFT_995523 [Pholiota molesta]